MSNAVQSDPELSQTIALLGGPKVLGCQVRTGLDAHDLLEAGLPSASLMHLTECAAFLTKAPGHVEKAIGISIRTLQRRKKTGASDRLSRDQSNRTWKFAELLGRAIDLLGSQEAAEAWMNSPAIGLDQRRPIDLLSTAKGTEAVEDYLTRMDYGVYG